MYYRQIVDKADLSRSCKFVIELIRSNSQVLEVGCATGYMTRELRNKGCGVTCVEIDRELARQAKEFSKEMIIGDIEDSQTLKNINNQFDYILFMDVLEHLRNPEAVLLAVKKYLKERGAVIVNIPNIAFYSSRLEIMKGRFDYQEYGLFDATHLKFYTYKTSKELLINAGYKIARTVPFLYFPGQFKTEKIYILGRPLVKLMDFISHKYPNLFGFSFTYIARPNP